MKDKKILLTTAVVLAVFTLIDVSWEILSNRWLRLLTSGMFLLLAFRIVDFKKLWGLSIFGLLMLCDFLLLGWEAAFAKHAYYSSHSLIMFSLLFLTVRELEWPKISVFEIVSVTLFLLVNSWILLTLRDYFSYRFEGALLKTPFSVNGFSTVFLVIAAFFYSINRPNKVSAFFFLSVLCLIVSELMLFSTYVLELQAFLYIDNLFYVIGLFFLLRCSQEHRFLEAANLIPEGNKKKEKTPEDSGRIEVYR